MPFEDGTGPRGRGPMTGRGLGPCRRGFGRGRGFGRRFGRGFGFRRIGYREPYFEQPVEEKTAKKQEKDYLEAELKAAEEDIKAIKQRLQELK